MKDTLGVLTDDDGICLDDGDMRAVNSRRPRYSMYVPHAAVDLICEDASHTRQEFADECDINSIMKRFAVTGVLPGSDRKPMYGDFADLPSYMEAQQILLDANDAFMALPAAVRREFDNDPAKFVAFAEDDKNLDKMREWGLAPPAAPPEKPLDAPKAPEAPKEPIAPAAPPPGA